MMHLKLTPRWRKVLRDLWLNKTRTALVVLSLVVGLFTISLLINAESALRSNFDREFAAVNPSSARLTIPEGFDQKLVLAVERMPEIKAAEGRRSTTVRLRVGTHQWVNLNLSAPRDFRDIRIDIVQPYSGEWPPPKGEILLERSSLRLGRLKSPGVGELLTLQTADGKETTLKFAGVAYDFNRTPSPGTGIVYGYATLDTLERLGEPTDLNELYIVVAQNKGNRESISRVANQVKDKVEKDGRTVAAIVVPEPGQHPLGTVLDSLDLILGTLSVLTLVGGALLVFNTIVALLAQQIRQIGMMKAVGARAGQIVGMYLGMVFVFGLFALAIATPLATVSGILVARFLADQFNLDLTAVQIPIQAFAVEALIAFGVPFVAALYPIWSGTRTTVQAALSDYGLSAKDEGRRMKDEGKGVNLFSSFILHPAKRALLPRPVLLSLRNTFRRKARLVLTLLPLALGGAVFISVINVRTSLESAMEGIFAYKTYDLDIAFEQPYRSAQVERAARTVPAVTRIESYHATSDVYRLRPDGSQSQNLSAIGLDPGTDILHLSVIAGRWLSPQDQEAVVLNDSFLRDEPDVRVGDRVSFKIAGRKTTLQVVGVVREAMAPDTLYMNDTYLSKVLGGIGRTNRVWVVTDPFESPDNTAQSLEAQFERADLRVAYITTASDQRDFVEFHFIIMIIPLGMAAFLLALVGGLGLMGTMTTNVLERQREIGVMRAIGASDGGIQKIFLVEGLVVGLISWLISIAASFPPSRVLNDLIGGRFLKAPLPDTLSLDSVLIWLVIVVVTVVLSCYLPARSASQTSVRELLAYE